MPKKKFFLFDCPRAKSCCDKSQYRESKFKEKIKFLLHIIICGQCREYTSKNSKLSKLIQKAEIKKCTEAEKEAHRKKLREASSSNKNN